MHYLYISLILIFTLSACDSDEKKALETTQKITQEIKQEKAQKDALLAELKAKDEALYKARLEAKAAKEKLLLQEQANKEAFLKSEAKKAKEKKEAIKNEKLSKVGITIEDNKITIDTNKTKDFFQNIGNKLGDKLKKITEDIQKGTIEEKDAGVKIDETHINIDLNKTKDFLEAWGQKMQGFVKEFDNMAKEIETETKQIDAIHTKGN